MHWIAQFRRDYRHKNGKIGLTEEEMAKLVSTKNTGCSKKLIEILEAGGITHPDIADRIAHVTGATPEQRDSIVHKKHRGKKFRGRKKKQDPQPFSINPARALPENTRGVVRIAPDGSEIERHASINKAAQKLGISTAAIHRRCHGEMWINSNEFESFGYTFRFASEWDSMTPHEKESTIAAARGRMKKEEPC